MKLFKNLLWGICTVIFIVCLVAFLKFGINYSKNESSMSDSDALKHSISMSVDKIVRGIKLEELKDDTGVFMVGQFVNTTGYDLPRVTILYEIVGKDGETLRQDKLNLGRIKKGETVDIKIAVGGMFDYSIRMTSSNNIGL